MAMSLNKVSLIGNVGKKPEIRTMQDSREMAAFGLATSETWKEKGTENRRTKTEWHRIVVFAPGLVRLIKAYVGQGARLYIEGSLQTRKWIGKDNVEKSTTEIVLQGYNSNLILLDNKQSNGSQINQEEPKHDLGQEVYENPSQSNNKHTELMEELDDEVPF